MVLFWILLTVLLLCFPVAVGAVLASVGAPLLAIIVIVAVLYVIVIG